MRVPCVEKAKDQNFYLSYFVAGNHRFQEYLLDGVKGQELMYTREN